MSNVPPPSDFGGTPPPPPGFPPAPPSYETPPPPPGAPMSPGQMPSYGQAGTPAQPPRPDVKLGAILTIVGSLLAIIGVFLPWATIGNETQNGTGIFLTSDFTLIENPGAAVIFFAVITGGLGIALFFAGRVLAVAIIAIVAAAIALLVGLGLVGMASDTVDFGDGSIEYGVIVQAVAPLVTLAGAIVATSKRRRWPTA